MSRNNNRHIMERKWIEATIVGACIALVVAYIQPLVATGSAWASMVGLLGSTIVVALVQLAILYWNKPRR